MSGGEVLGWSALVAMGLILVAMALTLIRLVRGPTLGDRIMALDMLTQLAVGFIAAFVVKTGLGLYLDIAIAVALVGLLATLALTRYLLDRRGGAE
jgi:multicomponent Na+:H+ antiporter subunit F